MAGQTRKLKWSLDDLDLTKPIEPLSRLVDEPEKLIDEVFKIAAQYLPKDIVPSSLKDIPTVELKKLCLEQLKKVERQTLLNILTTDPVDESEQPDDMIESSAEASSSCVQDKSTREVKDVEIQVEIKNKSSETKGTKSSENVESKSNNLDNSTNEKSTNVSDVNSNPDSILDQAELEIRELELRAQAIRELLKKHEEADNANQVSSESRRESRKRPRTETDSANTKQNTNQQEDNKSVNKSGSLMDVTHSNMEKKAKQTDSSIKEGKPTSRLSRNPVSMVEEDEMSETPEMPQLGKTGDNSTEPVSNGTREIRKKQSLDESSNENNIMMQLNNDSDDSIDRELKGE